MTINPERVMAAIITLLMCFFLIAMDAAGYINIGKFGYAGIGSWVTLVIQFYFRKKPKSEGTTTGTATTTESKGGQGES